MTADTVGGVWTYALNLIRAFADEGVHVGLATMGAPPSPAQREELAELDDVQCFESRFKLEWMEAPWSDVAAAGEWLLELEREFEPDVIHLNGYAHGDLPWRAPVLIAAHSCVYSWWEAVKREPAPANWDAYHRMVSRGLAAADRVIAPTHSMLRSLINFYGAPQATAVIPNGIPSGIYRPGAKEPFILSAGRLWDEAKNVRAVCACSFDLDWPVCVAGETQHPDGGAAGITGARFLGRLSRREMIDSLARAAIFAHPARYEPFGLAVLEAAASGCALMLGDIPSLRENWQGAAQFVDPADTDQLRTTLRCLAENAELRRHLAARARARASQFNIQKTAERYLQAYSSVLGQPQTAQETLLAV